MSEQLIYKGSRGGGRRFKWFEIIAKEFETKLQEKVVGSVTVDHNSHHLTVSILHLKTNFGYCMEISFSDIEKQGIDIMVSCVLENYLQHIRGLYLK